MKIAKLDTIDPHRRSAVRARKAVHESVRGMLAAGNAEVQTVYNVLLKRGLSKTEVMDEIGSAFVCVMWEIWNKKIPESEYDGRFSLVLKRLAEGATCDEIWPDE